jgi:hypothetical protein
VEKLKYDETFGLQEQVIMLTSKPTWGSQRYVHITFLILIVNWDLYPIKSQLIALAQFI